MTDTKFISGQYDSYRDYLGVFITFEMGQLMSDEETAHLI